MAIGDSYQTLEQRYGEQPVAPAKPPHHLVETQIFPQLNANEIIQVQPEQMSFVVGRGHVKKLKIINKSAIRQNFHVIEPLNTKIWLISYTKPKGGVIPGGCVDVTVKSSLTSGIKFIAPADGLENLYQDAIRIHSAKGNLLIPLYAYSTIQTGDWPEKVNFGSVPLGQESVRVIRLGASANESFDYSCTMHPPTSVFDIQPAFGTINGDTEITITYKPSEFVTSSTTIQIIFSTFDRKVLKCKINGNCLPGLLTLQKKREFALKQRTKPRELTDETPRGSWTYNKARRNVVTKPPEPPQQRLKPGDQHHINKILNSKEKSATKSNAHPQSYTDKSKAFRDKLRKVGEAEKINQLKWQVRRGVNLPDDAELDQVDAERRADQTKTGIINRTEREANTSAENEPNFDPYRNSPWRARHVAMSKFQQAARTVLIRIRGGMRLVKLRRLMKLVNVNGLTLKAAEEELLEQMGRQFQRPVNTLQLHAPYVHGSFVPLHDKFVGPAEMLPEDPVPVHTSREIKTKLADLEIGIYADEQGYEKANAYAVDSQPIPSFEAVLNEEGYAGAVASNIMEQVQKLKLISKENRLLCSSIVDDIISKSCSHFNAFSNIT